MVLWWSTDNIKIMKFNERSKAIIFIVSSIIHFSWLFAPIIDIDKFRSAEFSAIIKKIVSMAEKDIAKNK